MVWYSSVSVKRETISFVLVVKTFVLLTMFCVNMQIMISTMF